MWFVQDLSTDTLTSLGPFGIPGQPADLGFWKDSVTPSRVYVTKNRFSQFELWGEGEITAYSLGHSKTDSFVFLGRDIDSNGIDDVALLTKRQNRWSWRFSFAPLSNQSSNKRIIWGQNHHTPLLFRHRGKNDSAGVLVQRGSRSKIKFRSLNRRRKKTIRLRGFRIPQGSVLKTYRRKNGRDSFAYVEDKTLYLINNRGRRSRSTISVPSDGTLLVENYGEGADEEVVVFTEGTIIRSSGDNSNIADPDLQPNAGSSYSQIPREPLSPTLIPTSTPTSLSRPTPALTATPTGTSSPTPSKVPTPIPSATPTTIATATSTFTAIPTWTPQPTYTPFPTFTATFYSHCNTYYYSYTNRYPYTNYDTISRRIYFSMEN